jgi:hypothetical protein
MTKCINFVKLTLISVLVLFSTIAQAIDPTWDCMDDYGVPVYNVAVSSNSGFVQLDAIGSRVGAVHNGNKFWIKYSDNKYQYFEIGSTEQLSEYIYGPFATPVQDSLPTRNALLSWFLSFFVNSDLRSTCNGHQKITVIGYTSWATVNIGDQANLWVSTFIATGVEIEDNSAACGNAG